MTMRTSINTVEYIEFPTNTDIPGVSHADVNEMAKYVCRRLKKLPVASAFVYLYRLHRKKVGLLIKRSKKHTRGDRMRLNYLVHLKVHRIALPALLSRFHTIMRQLKEDKISPYSLIVKDIRVSNYDAVIQSTQPQDFGYIAYLLEANPAYFQSSQSS